MSVEALTWGALIGVQLLLIFFQLRAIKSLLQQAEKRAEKK